MVSTKMEVIVKRFVDVPVVDFKETEKNVIPFCSIYCTFLPGMLYIDLLDVAEKGYSEVSQPGKFMKCGDFGFKVREFLVQIREFLVQIREINCFLKSVESLWILSSEIFRGISPPTCVSDLKI